jgi:CheY-like chemotaxis protein
VWQITGTDALLLLLAAGSVGIITLWVLTGWFPDALFQMESQRRPGTQDDPRGIERDRRHAQLTPQYRAEPENARTLAGTHGYEDQVRVRSSASLKSLSVLLVADDDDSRAALAATLEDSGAHVVTATSAAEALHMLETHPAHVLVSDLRMPTQDGVAFIHDLRKRADLDLASIPAALITASRGIEDDDGAPAAGYQIHLNKPIDTAALVATILKLVTMPKGTLATWPNGDFRRIH